MAMTQKFTAEEVRKEADFLSTYSRKPAEMLTAYAATLRQQTTNAPENGSKLVDDGAVSDEVRLFSGDLDVLANLGFPKTAERIRAVLYRDVAPLLRAPAEQGGRVDGQWRKGDCFIESDADHWEAGIDQHGVPRNQSTDGVWHHRVVCYGPTEAEAASLRDQVLTALAQNAQGEPHYWLDEATMYGSKRKEFVRQIPLYLHAERARVPDGMTYQVRAVSDRPLGDAGWMVIDRDGMFKHPQQFDYRALAAPSQPEDADHG